MNDMTGESFEEQPFISRLGLCSNTPQVLMSPPDLSGSSTVCFPLRRGDRFGGGWQRSLFSPPESLEWRAGKLKTGFTRFLETIKQAGGPTVRERGRVRETVWQRVSRTRAIETPSQQIRNMCECMGRSVYVPACVCVCMCEREEKMIEWYRARAPARGFADAHKDLFTVSAPDDPPEDAGVAANTHPHWHTHHSGHISQQT